MTVEEILKKLKENDISFEILTGNIGLKNKIFSPEVNRPGLALTGFVEHFANERVQIFGKGEISFLRQLDGKTTSNNLDLIFKFAIPCCFISHNQEAPAMLIEKATSQQIPVILTELPTGKLIKWLLSLLEDYFAPRTSIHGVLVEVFGIGVLLQGGSGVGKSETALELIERGHRLVADDVIYIKKLGPSLLLGSGPDVIKHHMEIRGIGIININYLYGVSAVRDSIQIDLVVNLEFWDETKEYDRLGLDDTFYDILDTKIPFLIIPVKPGRNIPIIVETAAINQRLKRMGYHSAKEFNRRLREEMERNTSY